MGTDGCQQCVDMILDAKQLAGRPVSPDEQREFNRVYVELPGKLIVSGDETTIHCTVLNLSGGGAYVQCEDHPPQFSEVVLYVDGFGRFEGVTRRSVKGHLGIGFICTEAKRNRLLADISSFINDGLTTTKRLRRHIREASHSSSQFTRTNGERIPYEFIDLSLQGMSIKTPVRPPVGEIVNLGKTRGRIVRHHSDGLAIHFLTVIEPQHLES